MLDAKKTKQINPLPFPFYFWTIAVFAFSGLADSVYLSISHYRVYTDIAHDSDDFVFDNQILARIIWLGYTIAEVSCSTKCFAEASSLNLYRSIKYGLGCLQTALLFRLAKTNIIKSMLFPNYDI